MRLPSPPPTSRMPHRPSRLHCRLLDRLHWLRRQRRRRDQPCRAGHPRLRRQRSGKWPAAFGKSSTRHKPSNRLPLTWSRRVRSACISSRCSGGSLTQGRGLGPRHQTASSASLLGVPRWRSTPTERATERSSPRARLVHPSSTPSVHQRSVDETWPSVLGAPTLCARTQLVTSRLSTSHRRLWLMRALCCGPVAPRTWSHTS